MKQKMIQAVLAVAAVLGAMALPACQNYVQGIQPLQDVIQDDALNSPAQIPFSVQGVQRRLTDYYSQMTTIAGGLSDELIFDNRVPNATFPTFLDLDLGLPQLDNNSVNNSWLSLGQFRFLADNLIERALKTDFGTNTVQRNNALYQGYLHAGLARYFYAAYFGFRQREGHGIINNGPLIPAAAMMDSALAMYNLALQNAGTDLQRRILNSLIAKANLAESRFPAARAAAQNGLRRGDPSFDALYSAATVSNQWFFDAGRNRSQFVPNPRFVDYVRADSLEGRLVPGATAGGSFTATGFANTPDDAALAALNTTRRLNFIGPLVTGGLSYVIQLRYPNQSSPVPITSWQENELMLAETALRVANDATVALTNVNNVRTAIGLAARTVTNLDSVYIERDKQLFGTGTRLLDQRRFNRWHLPAQTWWVLPIGQPERNVNTNLPNN
jgi:hypothetical protein